MNSVSSKLRHYAVALLSRREYSALSLETKLKEYCIKIGAHDPQLVPDTILLMQQKGYQSDARYTEGYIRMRLDKLDGPMKIKQYLKQKGVSNNVIDDELSSSSVDWVALCEKLYRKKYCDNLPADYKEQQKYMRYLMSKGYPNQVIKYCLENIKHAIET